MTIKVKEPFTIWLIGPSASGKSTIAKELYKKIQSTPITRYKYFKYSSIFINFNKN